MMVCVFAEISTQTDSMGAGASRDGEEFVDETHVTRSQTGTVSGPHSPRPRSERSRSSVKQMSRTSMSRNVGK